MKTPSKNNFGKTHPWDLLLGFAAIILLLWAPAKCMPNQYEERIANGDTETKNTTAPPPVAANKAPVNSKGKALFRANCSSCHYASEKIGTGPGLKGVLGRIPGGEWKYNWVRNSAALTATGDAYSVQLKAKWNNAAMTAFPALSNEDIDAILEYADAGE
ncbi:MAG: cytochrome c [Bacteroidia bacterium]|jgi:cytochrome c2|nr:cytochrome c [Bacteroidia bacterium]